jgi:murein DD-endopeptidase MepM/ murein hydrolase activator NlpD
MQVGDVAIVKTPSGLNARTAPNGPVLKKNGANVVRPKGFKFKITALQAAGGRQWAKAKDAWYAAEYLGKYTKPKTPAKVVSPVPGYAVNYPYGAKNSGYKAGYHTGEDHAAPVGAKIVAVRNGTITRADWGGAYGNWTWLKADNGRTYVYCHQSARNVHLGQRVIAGQTIGMVGATGNVTGPHLHFECTRPNENWQYGRQVKPEW